MNFKKEVFLTLITENQSSKIKAEKFSEIVISILGSEWTLNSIEVYYKFENSYKIEFKNILKKENISEFNNEIILISNKIAAPWLVYYNDRYNTIELIFNKTSYSKINNMKFDVILWANLNSSEETIA